MAGTRQTPAVCVSSRPEQLARVPGDGRLLAVAPPEKPQKARFVPATLNLASKHEENISRCYFLRRCFSTSIKLPQRQSPKAPEPPRRKTKPPEEERPAIHLSGTTLCFQRGLYDPGYVLIPPPHPDISLSIKPNRLVPGDAGCLGNPRRVRASPEGAEGLGVEPSLSVVWVLQGSGLLQ